MIDPAEAARAILRGVRRNDMFIVFPLHAQVIWRLHRLHPDSLQPLLVRSIREYRALRSRP
jgi:short-subunit dehydrogenase